MDKTTKVFLIGCTLFVFFVQACAPAAPSISSGFNSDMWTDDGGGLYHRDVAGVRCFRFNGDLSCISRN